MLVKKAFVDIAYEETKYGHKSWQPMDRLHWNLLLFALTQNSISMNLILFMDRNFVCAGLEINIFNYEIL